MTKSQNTIDCVDRTAQLQQARGVNRYGLRHEVFSLERGVPLQTNLLRSPIAAETSVYFWLEQLPTAAIRDEENHVEKVLACWTKADFVFHLANFAKGT